MTKNALSDEVVALIKGELKKGDLSQNAIAEKFGISKHAVSKIKLGKTYAHVEIDEQGNWIRPVMIELPPVDKISKSKKVLNKRDVAMIKWLLSKGASNKEIADHWGIDGSNVSQINTGKIFKDVQFNPENGELITFKIRPEDFPCITTHSEEIEPLERIEDDTTPYRMAFVENYFERQGKYGWKPKGVKSEEFIKGLWNRFRGFIRGDRDEFMAIVMFTVAKVVLQYQPDHDSFDWAKVSDSKSDENAYLHSYINQVLRFEIRQEINRMRDTITFKKNGKNHYARPNVVSLNLKVDDGEGGENSLSDIVPASSSFWELKDNYTGSYFLQFFRDNHTKFLTETNIEFLNIFKYFVPDASDKYIVPYKHLPDDVKPFTASNVGRQKSNIKMATERALAESKPISLRKMKHQKELDFWGAYLQKVDECDDQQISDWVKKQINNLYGHTGAMYMERMTWELSSQCVLNLRMDVIPKRTLYRITDYAIERMEELEKRLKKDEKIVLFNRKKVKEELKEGQKYVALPTGIIVPLEDGGI